MSLHFVYKFAEADIANADPRVDRWSDQSARTNEPPTQRARPAKRTCRGVQTPCRRRQSRKGEGFCSQGGPGMSTMSALVCAHRRGMGPATVDKAVPGSASYS